MQASKVANFAFTADYDPPRLLVVVVSAGTAVATTVQKFIVMRMRMMRAQKYPLKSLKIEYV